MNPKTYNYRNGGTFFFFAFLMVWSIGWMAGWFSPFVTGTANINDEVKPVSEVAPLLLGIGSLGIVAFLAGLRIGGTFFNERIVLEDDQVSFTDWKGGSQTFYLSQIHRIDSASWGRNSERTIITTDLGEFKVSSTISNYFELVQALNASKGRVTRREQDGRISTERHETRPSPGYAWSRPPSVEARTFTYRFSWLHIFSFLWIGMCTFILLGSLSIGNSEGAPTAVVAPVFLGVGLWMQLTGWIERIQVDGEGIVWVDFLGRTRVRATWQDVLDLRESTGETNSLTIETRQGTIRASSYLRGYGELRSIVRSVVQSRV